MYKSAPKPYGVKEEAYKLLQDGWLQKDVALFLQTSQNTITKWVKEYNMKNHNLPLTERARMLKQAVYLHSLCKYSQTEIAKKVGVSTTTISKWFKELELNTYGGNRNLAAGFAYGLLQAEQDLPSFLMWLQLTDAKMYNKIVPFYNAYIKSEP